MLSKIFRNMKVGTKYSLAFSITILLICISTFIVYREVADVKQDLAALERRGDRAIKVTEMASLFRTKDIRIADYINTPEQIYIDEFEERREAYNELEKELHAKMDTPEEEKYFQRIAANDKKVNDIFLNEIVPAVKSENKVAVNAGRQKARLLRSETVKIFDDLRNLINEQRHAAVQSTKDSLQASINVLIISIIISVILGSIITFVVNRLIQGNLQKVIHMATEVSGGNLQVASSNYQGKDEIGQLSTAMNGMLINLRDMIGKINLMSDSVTSQSEEMTQSSTEVKAVSEQVASTMQELASGAEQQASTSGQLAETMDQFIVRLQKANEQGSTVSQTAQEVLTMTHEGNELMEQSIHKMKMIDGIVKEAVTKVRGLDQQSKDISSLVSVIQEVAEQTNLLALNAAIEAARAGEHGKGFAVVADEVRKLAEQVSQSVISITEIVNKVQSESASVAGSLEKGYIQVEDGTKQIEITGQTFTKMNTLISDVVAQVNNITRSLKEISENGGEMNHSISNIASVSEESAAGIEQTSASSQQTSAAMEEISQNAMELSKLAEDLNGLVSQFKV